MPIYDYDCGRCGPFSAMQPMARFQESCACPVCGAEASRTIVSAPAIASINLGGSIGHKAIQPSARYPRSSATHPAGCGCYMRQLRLPGALSAGGRVFTSHGPVRRSWL